MAPSQESITNATENSRHHAQSCGSDSSSTKSRSLGRSSSASTKSTAAADDELVEIINDFKNKVHSITEIEHLVEAWKNRDDVKQSFKDKQRQLSAMREEYERIQKTMKAEIKGPSPIDRIKNFFKGKKGKKIAIVSFLNTPYKNLQPKFRSNGLNLDQVECNFLWHTYH